jgi:hypothetical protein
MIDQKQLENVEYFNYLGSMITNDARCTLEIKSRIAMAKGAFNKKKTLFTSKLDSNLMKNDLMTIVKVMCKCCRGFGCDLNPYPQSFYDYTLQGEQWFLLSPFIM